MSTLSFDADDPVLAASAWSRLAEPGDETAGSLVAHLGPAGALAWLVDQQGAGPVDDLVAVPDGDGPRLGPHDGARRGTARRALAAGVARWSQRLDGLDPRRDLAMLERTGGTLLLPDDPRWPRRLDDLGAGAPFALWVRGDPDLAAACRRSVAVVGARASTSYGEHVTAQLVIGLVDRGFGVVSGGAYGSDAVAHRSAVVHGGRTVAVMAGGVDRFYPQGNHELLRRVAETGSVVAEVPPGSAPFKQRFLARNRLIAAMSAATVVVEAAWRSGALSTARRAADLLRPVGVVPGPVTSMASGGCHQLLRDGVATCVTDAAEVADLAGDVGRDAAPAKAGGDGALDALDDTERGVLDALPARTSADATALCRVAGQPLPVVLGALGVLESHGLVRCDGTQWRRVPPGRV